MDSGKIRYIRTSDDISFSYNYEGLNKCFGANMKGTLQHAIWDSKDGCLVWFPHVARLENGKYKILKKGTNDIGLELHDTTMVLYSVPKNTPLSFTGQYNIKQNINIVKNAYSPKNYESGKQLSLIAG